MSFTKDNNLMEKLQTTLGMTYSLIADKNNIAYTNSFVEIHFFQKEYCRQR